uniref:Pink-eyed dilution-like 2 n=1 Tax=Hartaetosiga gracilis TaxID=216892 RepID=A0A1D8RAF5_9EUKA|nr:pink-eyed dilution-like 2 [Hartaetosiga gracilis]|eukprot:m.64341 g.64341  ORF g.64341 m.64341 type:complete len:774 (+) comp8112_c0_seq3:255-2576(+)
MKSICMNSKKRSVATLLFNIQGWIFSGVVAVVICISIHPLYTNGLPTGNATSTTPLFTSITPTTNSTAIPSTSSAPLWQAIVVLVILVFMLVAMAAEVAPPDMIMIGTLALFIPMHIVTVEEAVEGFANNGMLTVGALFAVAEGVRLTGAIEPLRHLLERRLRSTNGLAVSIPKTLSWIMLPVAVLSAFLNNTPVVAMMIPLVQKLGQQVLISPSKLLMPLSYAAILGGTCTLIGTSTNLVAVGLVKQAIPSFSIGLFEIGKVGLPTLLAGMAYVWLFAGRILPSRQTVNRVLARPREYITCLFVKDSEQAGNGTLHNKSIASAGLRSLPGLYLIHIEREDGTIITAPPPNTLLQQGDKLFFSGKVDSVLSLSTIRGLRLAEDDEKEVDLNKLKGDDVLVEAVIAPHSALVHRTIKAVKFRSRYDAAIIAVHRHGQRINQKIGEIELQAGDSLLIVTKPSFLTMHRDQEHFALVSLVDGHETIRWSKAPIAILCTFLMVILTVADVIELFTAALFAIAAMVIFRCMSTKEVRESINLEVLLVIAAAFGISNALINSGAADLLAKAVIIISRPTGVTGLYIMVYLTTMLFSAAVTNNAAITIMFPVAFSAATELELDFRPFLFLLMMGASASFMTPTGYQTNLMVYGPGGYKFMDFIRFGGILQVWCGVVSISVIATLDYWWLWTLILMGAMIATLFAPQPTSIKLPQNSPRRDTAGLQEHLTGEEGEEEETETRAGKKKEVYFYQPDLGLSKMEYFDDEVEEEEKEPLNSSFA